jgi:hypothetical protein
MSRREEKRESISLVDLPIDTLNLVLNRLDLISQRKFKRSNKRFYQDQDLEIRYKLLYDENNKVLKRIQVNELKNYQYKDNIFEIDDISFSITNLDDLYIFSINNKKLIIYNNIIVFEYKNTYYKYENNCLIKLLLLDNIDELPIIIDYKNQFKLIYKSDLISEDYKIKLGDLYFIRFDDKLMNVFCYCIYLDKNDNNLSIQSYYNRHHLFEFKSSKSFENLINYSGYMSHLIRPFLFKLLTFDKLTPFSDEIVENLMLFNEIISRHFKLKNKFKK